MIAPTNNDVRDLLATKLHEKEQSLRSLMRDLGKVLVAYSGGVDSAFLAKIATEELGTSARCVIGLSPSVSEYQRETAFRIARDNAFSLETIDTRELSDPDYAANPTNRCYFCKSELYASLTRLAGGASILDGTNADDLSDHRPGRTAAAENGVRSPLAELGFAKRDIRELSRRIGLETWDKPASPCLSSRIAHGVPVTIERLSQVERGEAVLRGLGFREFRVRVHDEIARIEISKGEMHRFLDESVFARVGAEFAKLGFRHVTLDLAGFRSGSMNVAAASIKK